MATNLEEELKKTSLAETSPAAGSTATAGTGSTATGTTQESSFNPTDKLKGYATGYTPSDSVTQAKNYLQSIIEKKPGEFNSQYDSQIKTLYEQLQNRPKFSYDLDGDALYQQYKNQYQRLGQQAMQDTVGNAAALTGGYGNSWAATAGSQAYQDYLSKLNDIVPELYNQAYSRYTQEGDDLRTDISLINSLKDSDYSMYRAQISDWQADRAYAQNAYEDEYERDYGQWGDMMNYWKLMYDLGLTDAAESTGTGGDYSYASSGGSGSGGSGSGSGSSTGDYSYTAAATGAGSGSNSTGIPWTQLNKNLGMTDTEATKLAQDIQQNLSIEDQKNLANTFQYKLATESGMTMGTPEYIAMQLWKKNGGASNAKASSTTPKTSTTTTKKITSTTTAKKNALKSILME